MCDVHRRSGNDYHIFLQVVRGEVVAGVWKITKLISLMHSSLVFIYANGCFGYFILNHCKYKFGKLRLSLSSGLGKIVFWISLEMTKLKIINPFVDTISMMIQIYLMSSIGA